MSPDAVNSRVFSGGTVVAAAMPDATAVDVAALVAASHSRTPRGSALQIGALCIHMPRTDLRP